MLQFAKLIDFSKHSHTLQLMNAAAALFPVCVCVYIRYVYVLLFFFIVQGIPFSVHCPK